MGVEYRNFLLPKDRDFVPAAKQIVALVERLRKDRWVLTPDNPILADLFSKPAPHHQTGGWAEPFVAKSTSLKERWEKATPIPIPLTTAWLNKRRDPRAECAQADELALHFPVGSGVDTFEGAEMPYPLAYGEDESGSHEIFIQSARDFVVWDPAFDAFECECGAALDYEIAPRMIAPIQLEKRVRAVCPGCDQPLRSLERWRAAWSGEEPVFRFCVFLDFEKAWPTARRVGEPEGIKKALESAGNRVAGPNELFLHALGQDHIRKALEAAGKNVDEMLAGLAVPPPPRERAAADNPKSSKYDANVLRSPYGDPAPPLHDRFVQLVEEVIDAPFVSVPQFY